MNRKIEILFSFCLLASCHSGSDSAGGSGTSTIDNTPPSINFIVAGTLPHDTSSFTEGLLIHGGKIYESTGTEPDLPADRCSIFGPIDTLTGRIVPKAKLDREKFFGEGIVFLGDKVYQLTWKTKMGFIYDANSFKAVGQFTFPTKEGWGMTTNGAQLIMSDGGSNIYYLDPTGQKPIPVNIRYDDSSTDQKTLNLFRTVKTLPVTDNNGPVINLNEPELINGYLYVNQWQTNYILKIDTSSGKVVGKLDLDSVVGDAKIKFDGLSDMNGIAYDATTDKIYITGKRWKNIYEVRFPH